MNDVKVLGKRVMVKKDRIECGGMKLTPALEEGEKNKGTIVAVGSIGILAWLRGVRVGATVVYHKHFTPNHVEGQEGQEVFVELDNVLGILK